MKLEESSVQEYERALPEPTEEDYTLLMEYIVQHEFDDPMAKSIAKVIDEVVYLGNRLQLGEHRTTPTVSDTTSRLSPLDTESLEWALVDLCADQMLLGRWQLLLELRHPEAAEDEYRYRERCRSKHVQLRDRLRSLIVDLERTTKERDSALRTLSAIREGDPDTD